MHIYTAVWSLMTALLNFHLNFVETVVLYRWETTRNCTSWTKKFQKQITLRRRNLLQLRSRSYVTSCGVLHMISFVTQDTTATDTTTTTYQPTTTKSLHFKPSILVFFAASPQKIHRWKKLRVQKIGLTSMPGGIARPSKLNWKKSKRAKISSILAQVGHLKT